MLFQATCRGDEILEHFYVICSLYFEQNFRIDDIHLRMQRPLLCLASDEFATSNQVEFACAALSNMAAIEENQRPLCKAGAIGILSAIEIEIENSMAACKTYLEIFQIFTSEMHLDHAHNALHNISGTLSRNICRSLISHSNDFNNYRRRHFSRYLADMVTVDLITMEPEHLRLKTFQNAFSREDGLFHSVAPAASLNPQTPSIDSIPMHVGASNPR